ncbi:baseplate multidomain protein megatron [Pseudovibrio exalbescens]|uniref:GTA TIM-barrel-like domain protein n=1 Tax=Pseudovibrio exalbescens TaxID=197461 RepID=A0A1U7JEM3_9HYPH|nr:glycoside hydrolase/phage tail family protein [Pseudovibrio exalbescens]OKL43193.1 hypothetical protein A3843_15925 [Pseudovibrio exalbescens]
MATMILSGVGSAVGGAIAGPFGAILGQALGALGGAAIDRAVFSREAEVERGQIGDVHLQTSSQGQGIPRVYGRARLSGEVIWATRYEEVVSREKQGGGKGGGGTTTTVTTHSYFANFAIGLCEGPISDVRRIWADGKPLDRESVNMRIYHGTADQLPDPLIEAKQGVAPAYRNLAYVVFERLPLADYGNRLPQLSFEVVRAVEPLEAMVRGVSLIPGADEFIYSTTEVLGETGPGARRTLNRHFKVASSDLAASLDELQALCPNLESVALVVSWFGDDLRCANCVLEPKVTLKNRRTWPRSWQVAGKTRETARAVSQVDGRPAYGGTPSDDSVREAIAELKQRGLKVMFYPFILMDIPEGNGKPDPYGGSEQAAHPWRGRITTSLAAEMAGTPQGTAAAAPEIEAFVGGMTDAGYRRFLHHCADLAVSAGGVDAFLIGTELKNLTRAYAEPGRFPFVDALVTLLHEIRSKLGPATKLSYAADWSEYGGFSPQPGELRFPLDPLWADAQLDAIGIDWYVPLSDWRGGESAQARYDPERLRAGLTSGEYHDWYYASTSDRDAGTRTTITDGAYGKPWVYRAKDLKSWWQNPHVERIGEVELGTPTAWVPESKPIWLTELGFPAVDKGTNQPNVFFDPKSAESAFPHFSSGTRDDLVQRRALEASLSFAGIAHPTLQPGEIPISSVYGGPMIDPHGVFLWTWDARPFPAFPTFTGEWADGENWYRGHWLNGRLGAASSAGMLRQLLADFDVPSSEVRVEEGSAKLDGLVVPGIASLRQVLEPLLGPLGLIVADEGAQVAIRSAWAESDPAPLGASLGLGDVVVEGEETAPLTRLRESGRQLPAHLRLSAYDPFEDYARTTAQFRYVGAEGDRVLTQSLQISLSRSELQMLCEKQLQGIWASREAVETSVSHRHLALTPGETVALDTTLEPDQAFETRYRITRMAWGDDLKLEAQETCKEPVALSLGVPTQGQPARFSAGAVGPPEVVIANLPILTGTGEPGAPFIAAFSDPWPGPLQIYRSNSGTAYELIQTLDERAVMGVLAAPLAPGPVWRWDMHSTVVLTDVTGALQGADPLDVLAGGNPCAVESEPGHWEILQFTEAELVGPHSYELSGLLRGQRGTEALAGQGAPAGARFVLLNEAVQALPWSLEALQRDQYYRMVPAREALDSRACVDLIHASDGKALMPFAPVHVKVRRLANADLEIKWVRRTRANGDSWALAQVPLNETEERYQMRIETPAGNTLQVQEVAQDRWIYTYAMRQSDSVNNGDTLIISVAQLSELVGPGGWTRKTVEIKA